MATRIELPQGTLDLLILQTLAVEPQHGWAISERVQQISSDALRIKQGTDISSSSSVGAPRMDQGPIGMFPKTTDGRTYYQLTMTERRQLELRKGCVAETHPGSGAGARNGLGG